MGVIMDEPAKPAGYVRERPVYKLVFSDPSMAGLTVRVRALSFGDALAVGERTRDDNGHFLVDQVAKEFFSDRVFVDWNLQHPDGTPVPGTVDGLYTQDRSFLEAVLWGWMRAMSGEVPAPLEQPSPDGEPFPEGSIPMEPLSPNPPS